jgi:hypothetical protein
LCAYVYVSVSLEVDIVMWWLLMEFRYQVWRKSENSMPHRIKIKVGNQLETGGSILPVIPATWKAEIRPVWTKEDHEISSQWQKCGPVLCNSKSLNLLQISCIVFENISWNLRVKKNWEYIGPNSLLQVAKNVTKWENIWQCCTTILHSGLCCSLSACLHVQSTENRFVPTREYILYVV